MFILSSLILVSVCCLIDSTHAQCSVLENCNFDYIDFANVQYVVESYFDLSVAAKYTEFCELTTNETSCVSSKKASCTDKRIVREVIARNNGDKYVCSTAGRTAITGLGSSSCVSNRTQQAMLRIRTRTCRYTYASALNRGGANTDYSAVECSALNTFVPCSTNAATTACGTSYGTLLNAILNLEKQQYPECNR